MEDCLKNKLLKELPGIKNYNIMERGLPNGDWFVFETSPISSQFPSMQQLVLLTADINNDREFYIYNDWTLEHLDGCREKDHYIHKDIRSAIKNITSQKFVVAVWENEEGIYSGQPIVIPLEPEIDHITYPDHPHMNNNGLSQNYFLPYSVCYTDDPSSLGNNPYDRIKNAMLQTSVWLYKHQIWLSTRSRGKGLWIGPSIETEDKDQFNYLRNPYGVCRCGSNLQYYKCHLQQDFDLWKRYNPLVNLAKYDYINTDGSINIDLYNRCWEYRCHNPQMQVMKRLRGILH